MGGVHQHAAHVFSDSDTAGGIVERAECDELVRSSRWHQQQQQQQQQQQRLGRAGERVSADVVGSRDNHTGGRVCGIGDDRQRSGQLCDIPGSGGARSNSFRLIHRRKRQQRQQPGRAARGISGDVCTAGGDCHGEYRSSIADDHQRPPHVCYDSDSAGCGIELAHRDKLVCCSDEQQH